MTLEGVPNQDDRTQLFCPACGRENSPERSSCSACGADLSLIRSALSNAQHHYNAAVDLARRNELDAAERELLTAIEYYSREPRFHTLLGTVYARRGLFDLAVRSWEAAIELDPQSDEAYQCIRRARRLLREAEAQHAQTPWQRLTTFLVIFSGLVLCLCLYLFMSARHSQLKRREAVTTARQLRDQILTMTAVGQAQPPSADYEALRVRFEKQTTTVSALQADLAMARAQAEQLEQEANRASVVQASLEEELSTLRQQAAAARSRADSAEAALAEAQRHCATEALRCSQIEETARQLEQEVARLTLAMADAARGQATDATVAQDALAQLAQLQEQLAQAERQLATATAERDTALVKLRALEATLGDGAARASQLETRLAELQAQLTTAQQRATSAEAQAAAVQVLEASLAQQTASVAKLSAEVATLTSRAAQAEQSVALLTAEVALLREAIRTFTVTKLEEAAPALRTAANARPDDKELGQLARFAENELTRNRDPLWRKVASEFFYEKARELYKDGKYEEALAHVNQALEILPNWRNALRLRSDIEEQMKR